MPVFRERFTGVDRDCSNQSSYPFEHVCIIFCHRLWYNMQDLLTEYSAVNSWLLFSCSCFTCLQNSLSGMGSGSTNPKIIKPKKHQFTSLQYSKQYRLLMEVSDEQQWVPHVITIISRRILILKWVCTHCSVSGVLFVLKSANLGN